MYRDFARPGFSLGKHSASDWLQWGNDEGVFHDFAPMPAGACDFCGGAMDPARSFSRCWDCGSFSTQISHLVPVSYSLDSGLESMLHRYKDWEEYGWPDSTWMSLPLASLLKKFLKNHLECLRSVILHDYFFTWVPKDNPNRSFDQIEELLTYLDLRDDLPWRADLVARNPDEDRPRRKEVVPSAYLVNEDEIAGRSIVVVDDLWTSGASLASVASALRGGGAAQVIGLPLGRQLRRNNTYGNAQALLAEVEARGWTGEQCTICAR